MRVALLARYLTNQQQEMPLSILQKLIGCGVCFEHQINVAYLPLISWENKQESRCTLIVH
jgi:hypothetical protein